MDSDDETLLFENPDDLYDSHADDSDEEWVTENLTSQGRKDRLSQVVPPRLGREKQKEPKKKPQKAKDESEESDRAFGTDAILSCPACFTTLCVQCQRHEIYTTQYRAVSVLECRVGDNVLQDPKSTCGETFRPVQCDHCGADVAVLDDDDVYHFFAAIPSH
eukprot:Rmarinus@m.20001